MNSKFKKVWDDLLKVYQMPKRCTGIISISYKQLKELCENFDKKNSEDLINNLINGKILLIKEAFSIKEIDVIKSNILNFWKNNPDTYYKMTEGCPDFHRIITPEIAKNYSVGAVRHTTYFFPWNNDPCKFNQKIYERWRYSKYLGGLAYDEYENNTPKDGNIDRIQVVCYPPTFGGVETHVDTDSNNPLAISCYLSERGKDYKTGGFYCVDEKDKIVDIEPEIEMGDISLYCPTIEHGVETIDSKIDGVKIDDYDWNSGQGRWWMGLFTNDSNLKTKRKTSKSLAQFHSSTLND